VSTELHLTIQIFPLWVLLTTG